MRQRSLPWIGVGITALTVAAFFGGVFYRSGSAALIEADERAAVDALRRIALAEREWRSEDGDGNAIPDYWTGDLSGLFRGLSPDGRSPSGFLPVEIASADVSPLPPTEKGRPRLTDSLPAAVYKGYRFRALRKLDGKDLALDGPDDDAHAWENPRAFAFVAFPAAYGVSGRATFVVREDGAVRAKDIGAAGEKLTEWPVPAGGDGWQTIP